MGKHYLVLAKQVPDTKKVTGKAMNDDGTMNRSALPAIFNPDDMCALEMALRLKDQYGGKVTVITMGPPSANEILRQALYRGVDKCILLTDRKFAGSDTLATSMVLSKAIEKIKDYSLVICGRQAIDGDTAQVGPQTAEKIGIPQITYVEDILNLTDKTVEVKKIIENGYEIKTGPLPILLTCCATAESASRPASAKMIQKHKKSSSASEITVKAMTSGLKKDEAEKAVAEQLKAQNGKEQSIEEWNIETIGIDPEICGLSGSPTWVKNIESVILSSKEHKSIDPTDQGLTALVSELICDHILD